MTHVITGLRGAGAEGALYRLLAAEVESPIEHRVVSLTSDGAYGERIRALGVPVVALGMPRGAITPGGLLRLYRLLRGAERDAEMRCAGARATAGRRRSRRRRRGAPGVHIIQTWMYHADLIGGLVGRIAGCRRVVWGIRHSDLDRRHASRSVRAVARVCARLSASVPREAVSCSERAVAVHRAIGYRVRFSVVANGYDLRRLTPDESAAHALRTEWLGGDDRSRGGRALIGTVGRYTAQKDHAGLLDALSRIPDGERPRCVLAGDGCTPANAELTAAIARRGLEDRVVLAGARSDIPEVMAALDFHVLPAAGGEAFPNVLAEAMACGTPCVTTDVGDAASIVAETGWVVAPRDPRALAGAIEAAIAERTEDSSAWERRRRAARERVAACYSIETMRDGFRAVWARVARRRVLLLAPSMRGGGAERVIALLSRALDRRRFELSLVLVSAEGPFLREIPADVEIVDLAARRARYAAVRLAGEIRRRRPETVLATLGHINLILALIRPVLPRGTRLLAREANTVSESIRGEPHPRLYRVLYRALYRRFDRVVCQSRYMADDLVSGYRVPRERISVIGNPVDVEAIDAAAAPDQPPSGGSGTGSRTLQLLAVGRLDRQKGFDLLLEALSIVERPVCLSVLGDGPEREALLDRRDALGLADCVRFEGFSDNPYRAMVAADALALPSRYEGLPNVVLEAGVLGVPAIAFDCPGGTAEIVEPGVTGVLVPCGDVRALAAAIERFDRAGWDGERIRERVQRRNGLALICREYEKVLCG